MNRVAIEYTDSYQLEVVKASFARIFDDLGFPKKNPLSNIVHPGDCVFIKPNWVASRWRASCSHTDSLYSVITHPAVIEAMADYVAEALQGNGEIIIGDNPSIDADFSELMAFTGIENIKNKYDVPVRILDLRPLVCKDLANYGKKYLMASQKGDPLGSVEVNLGKKSLLYGLDPTRFRGVFDEREETIASHSGETHLYTYAKSLYNADVYISIPKLKTHQKVGATLNLKGLVGSISNKNQLVHWQVGYPEIHGDEYPSKAAYEEGQIARIKHRGAWPGNDTIWRMVVDLYQGMKLKPRRYFSVIDGILAGEGQGPFCPTSKTVNTLIAGEDLLVVDCVGVRYMGIDPNKVKYLDYFLQECYENIRLNDISVIENGVLRDNFFFQDTNYADFRLIDAWKEVKYTI